MRLFGKEGGTERLFCMLQKEIVVTKAVVVAAIKGTIAPSIELKSVYQIDWINVKRIHDRINLSLYAHWAALQLSSKY